MKIDVVILRRRTLYSRPPRESVDCITRKQTIEYYNVSLQAILILIFIYRKDKSDMPQKKETITIPESYSR